MFAFNKSSKGEYTPVNLTPMNTLMTSQCASYAREQTFMDETDLETITGSYPKLALTGHEKIADTKETVINSELKLDVHQKQNIMNTEVSERMWSKAIRDERFNSGRDRRKSFVLNIFNASKKQYIDDHGSYPFNLVEQRINKEYPIKLNYYYDLSFLYDNYSESNSILKKEFGDNIDTVNQMNSFFFEMDMADQYYYNQVHDKKGGIITEEAIERNLLLAADLEKYILLSIQEAYSSNYSIATLIIHAIQKINHQVESGQKIEKYCNKIRSYLKPNTHTFENLASGLYIDKNIVEICRREILRIAPELNAKNEFLTLYLNRVYLIGAYMYQAINDLIVELLDVRDQVLIQKIRIFSGLYGMMMQIVNDITDFVPTETSAKNKDDVMSDLKGRNVTLPVLIHLVNNPDSMILPMLLDENHDWSKQNTDEILKEFLLCGSLKKARRIGRALAYKAAACLTNIPNEPNEVRIFQNMCGIALNNKEYMQLDVKEAEFLAQQKQKNKVIVSPDNGSHKKPNAQIDPPIDKQKPQAA
jgi:hypothetical protein